MEQKAYGGRTAGDISPSEFARLEGGNTGHGAVPSIPQVDHNENGCGCGCNTCGCNHNQGSGDGGWGLCHYPLAMVYAPCQAFRSVYDVETALARGTLFAELDLPFEAAGGCDHDNRRACR